MSEKPQGLRRFYKTVELAADPAGGWTVHLDGRAPRSPAKAALTLPTTALADRVAQEWQRQGEIIDLPGMGLTRMAYTSLDLTPQAHAALATEHADYAGSDLLSYRAEAPAGLVELEAAAWDPWLAWAKRELQVELMVAEGVTPVAQSAEALARARALAAGLDRFALIGLAFATALFGSAVLAQAALRGAIDASEAYELSRVDEAWQEKLWGEDAEAVARTAHRRREARLVGDWFTALR